MAVNQHNASPITNWAVLAVVAMGVLVGPACARKEREQPTIEFCGTSHPLDTTRVVCHSATDLSPLAKLTKLSYLDLRSYGERRLLSDLTPLAGLTELETLNVAKTWIVDLQPLAKLTRLRSLDLSETAVVDLTPLGSLRLEVLHLRDAKELSDASFRELARLTTLMDLILDGTQIKDLTPVRTLTGLDWLSLGRTQVTDVAVLTSLPKLRSLNVGLTDVSDLGPLATITTLRSLDVNATKVTDVTPLAKLVGLHYLDIGRTNIAAVGPLASLTGLQTLRLPRGDVDLAPLAALVNLIDLHAEAEGALRLFSKTTFPKLEILWIEATAARTREPRPVTDLSPLANLPALRDLSLVRLRVDDLGPTVRTGTLREIQLHDVVVASLAPLVAHKGLERLGWYMTSKPTDLQVKELRLARPDLKLAY